MTKDAEDLTKTISAINDRYETAILLKLKFSNTLNEGEMAYLKGLFNLVRAVNNTNPQKGNAS